MDCESMRAAMSLGLNTILGTQVPTDTPLMSVGLDSIAAVEFVSAVSGELGTSISPVVLFDHPTLDSIASYLARGLEEELTEIGGGSQVPVVGGDVRTPLAGQPPKGEVGSAFLSAASYAIGGSIQSGASLQELATRARATSSSVPAGRWVVYATGAPPAAAYGSFLGTEGLGLDAGSFGISALEAGSMDPQQSLVLHSGYAALVQGNRREADAEGPRAGLVYSGVGVFVGVEPSGLVQETASVFSATGAAASITSGRLSYVLGLVGPCYTIDTACSSALAAVHVCTMALLHEECKEAVAVGTKVLSEAANYGTASAGMTSPLGRCHTLDSRADGYCRGEGCGAYRVCETTSGAQLDMIAWPYNVLVVGSAVRQDGPSASLTAPNGSSQRQLLDVVSDAGCDEVGCNSALEAHGTGTALGDPIEVMWPLFPFLTRCPRHVECRAQVGAAISVLCRSTGRSREGAAWSGLGA